MVKNKTDEIKNYNDASLPEVIRELIATERKINPELSTAEIQKFLDGIKFDIFDQTKNIYADVNVSGDEIRFSIDKACEIIWENTNNKAEILGVLPLLDLVTASLPVSEGFKKSDWVSYADQIIRNFRNLREITKFIAENYERFKNYDDNAAGLFFPFDIEIRPTINKQGKFDVLNDPFIEALSVVEIIRLKMCLVCRHIFFADDLRRKFCSKKCLDNYSQRTRRADKKKLKEINEQRKRNRDYKKAIQKEGGK